MASVGDFKSGSFQARFQRHGGAVMGVHSSFAGNRSGARRGSGCPWWRSARRLSLISLLWTWSACFAVAHAGVTVPAVDNRLAECVDISPKGVRVENARLVFDADFVVKQPIGVCGCTSVIAGYHSIVVKNGTEDLVHRDHFDLVSSGFKTFDLGPVVKGGASSVVRFMCAGPQ